MTLKAALQVKTYLFLAFTVVIGVLCYTVLGSTWNIEKVTGNSSASVAVDVDDAGKVHISYIKEGEYPYLIYSTNVTGTWTTTEVDNSGYIGGETSIATDSTGKIHIGYYDYQGWNSLKYATNASGSWISTTITSSNYWGAGEYLSIAVDSNDKVHCSYYDDVHFNLMYATNVSGQWEEWLIDDYSDGGVGKYNSIAIDSKNHIHISYSGNGLEYATNASGSWTTETIDNTISEASTSIAIDSSDKVHVSYRGIKYHKMGSTSYHKYATNVSGSWVVDTVDASGEIALDSKNNVYVCYAAGNMEMMKNILEGISSTQQIAQAHGRLPQCILVTAVI